MPQPTHQWKAVVPQSSAPADLRITMVSITLPTWLPHQHACSLAPRSFRNPQRSAPADPRITMAYTHNQALKGDTGSKTLNATHEVDSNGQVPLTSHSGFAGNPSYSFTTGVLHLQDQTCPDPRVQLSLSLHRFLGVRCGSLV